MNRRRIDRREQVARGGATVRSLAGTFLRVALSFALAGGVGYGAWRGYGYLTTSEKFALKGLSFSGVSHASEEELTRKAGLVAGTNIFAVDLAQAARAMEQDAWVKKVVLTRELPDTLRISVQEHKPAALVAASGLYAVDTEGMPFKRISSSDTLDLPVITGISREKLEGGKDGGALQTALAILAAYEKQGMHERAELAELHVDVDSGELVWTAYCGDEQPVEVRLGALSPGDGPEAAAEVVTRLQRVWDEIPRRQARARARFIDVGNRQRPEWVAVRVE